MIKRYILHLEWHWGYRPRVKIDRAPYHGQHCTDGGVPGTLEACKECGGVGYLHRADAQPPTDVLAAGPHTWQGSCCVECEADVSWCPYPPPRPRALSGEIIVHELDDSDNNHYEVGNHIWSEGVNYKITAIAHDMDGTKRNLYLKRSNRRRLSDHTPRPAMDVNAPSSGVMEFPIINDLTHEQVVEALGESVESPETLTLGYANGTKRYQGGEIVWTRRAEYVVDGIYDDKLYLTRKDVWEARNQTLQAVDLSVAKTPEQICKCRNLADEFMPPSELIGDYEARRRGLWTSKDCPVHGPN